VVPEYEVKQGPRACRSESRIDGGVKADLPKVAMAEVASVLVVDGNTYIRTMHEDTREYKYALPREPCVRSWDGG